MNQAVILAAGRGMRLGPLSGGVPKCLLDLGGLSVLEHQITTLQAVGISSICVVAGHEEGKVRDAVADLGQVTILSNPDYANTNSLYSLWLARNWVSGPFLCVNGDLVAHPEAYHRVEEVDGCALAFDSGSGREDEHMKIQMDGRRLLRISKELEADSVHGENLGILRFSAEGASRLFAEAGAVVAAGGHMSWAPSVLNRLAPAVPILCVDVHGLPWVEVDFPADLSHAREVVWPSILRDTAHPTLVELSRAEDLSTRRSDSGAR